jgi:hypothetical protein
MTRRQAIRYGKLILDLKDEQDNKRFDSLALFRKPQDERGIRYAIGVRDVRSGQMLRLSTRHEVNRFLKEQKRK